MSSLPSLMANNLTLKAFSRTVEQSAFFNCSRSPPRIILMPRSRLWFTFHALNPSTEPQVTVGTTAAIVKVSLGRIVPTKISEVGDIIKRKTALALEL